MISLKALACMLLMMLSAGGLTFLEMEFGCPKWIITILALLVAAAVFILVLF